MRPIVLFFVLLLTQTLYAQTMVVNPKPFTLEGTIRWEGRYEYKTNPYDTLYGFYTFHPESVSYYQGGRIVWTIALPDRMQGYEVQSIYDKTTDSLDKARKLTKDEIDVNKFYYKEFLKCPVFINDKIVAVSYRSGFLLIDKLKGNILIDIQYQLEEDFFWFDEGNLVVKSGKNTCKQQLLHGSSFITSCGGMLFHFNEQELVVFDSENNFLKRIRYKRNLHLKKTKSPLHYKALIASKGFHIEMEGIVFVK